MREQPERIRGDRGPDAEKMVIAAMKQDYAAGHADLDLAIDLCRHKLAESHDPVLAFGLLKITLGIDQLDPERILRALAAAAQRLAADHRP